MGSGFGQGGRNIVNRRSYIHLVALGGVTPHVVVTRGDYDALSFVAAPSPSIPCHKNKTVCVLGMCCGRLAGASELSFRQLEQARARPLGVFSLYPPMTEGHRGLPLFDRFLQFLPPRVHGHILENI